MATKVKSSTKGSKSKKSTIVTNPQLPEVDDMEIIKMETDYVSGLPENMGGSGDPSPVTAYGVYVSMKASAKEAYGTDSLSGKKILANNSCVNLYI